MPINTNFDVNPYFDDYNDSKNFHKILFKAATPVQARELTQLQTILQAQIERFGENIIREGSIVKGGNFVDLPSVPYVKIADNNINNQPIVIGNYKNARITGRSSGVTALVIHYEAGLETQSPDLNTLYIKYTGTGQNGAGQDIKVFIPGEILEFTVGGIAVPELSVAAITYGVDPNPVGNGYLIRCGDGIIFQKGHFVGFSDQITTVTKYSTKPHNLVVGFNTEESIIDSNADTSLLDNARGFNNFNAPGADRLKLTPILVTYTEAQAEDDNNFFAIQEYQNGNLIRRNVTTQYSTIEKFVEKRTAEESGNYVVNGFNVSIKDNLYSTTKLSAAISAGVGYVEGKRVDTVSEYNIDLDKGTDFGSVSQQNILANYGNYIVINGTRGTFDSSVFTKINLYSSVQSAVTIGGFTPVGTKIGEARIRAFTRNSSTEMRLYLFDIRMNSGQSFVNVKSVVSTTNNAFGNLVLESAKAVLKDSSFRKTVFALGKSSIREVMPADTDYVKRKYVETSATSAGVLTVTLSGNETFPQGAGATLNTDARSEIIITRLDTGVVLTATSAVVGGGGTDMTINVGSLGATTNVAVSLNVKVNSVLPIGKNLKTVYMRINPTGLLKGPFALGWADVHSIEKIWSGPNLTFTEATSGISDVTAKFLLNKNANEDFYDISTITPRSNYSIGAAERFLVKAKVFEKVTSSGYSQSFFTINSYPVDDTTAVLPANKVRTEDIDVALRNSIDFRPYAINNAAYAETPAAATTWTNAARLNGISFGAAALNMIAPNQSVETTYGYYLGRIDRLIVNSSGDFNLLKGVPSENPIAPRQPSQSMTLSIINVPPFPTLTPARAARIGKLAYAATTTSVANPRYTMRDIKGIDDRVKRLEYATVLNALEKSAEDMVVKDANGLNRFKNGIVVDNYSDLLLCDVKDDDFKASVDRAESAMLPRQRGYDLPLKIGTGSGGLRIHTNGTATLNYTSVAAINQPYATMYRNCVTDFYNYSGTTELNPEYDSGYETTFAPDVNVGIDVAGAFSDFTEALNEIVPLRVETSSSTSNSTVATTVTTTGGANSSNRFNTNSFFNGTTTTTARTTTTTTNTTTNSTELTQHNVTNTQRVGDFVSDISFGPYMRENIVEVFTKGLRPNTAFYVFFDGRAMAQYVAPATLMGTALKATTSYGAGQLRSNAQGILNFLMRIPANTFYTGDRELIIMDVPDMASEVAATSTSKAIYRGFNVSVEKTGLEISTRMPQFGVETNTTTSTVTTSSTDVSVNTVISRPLGGGSGNGRDGGSTRDPIAQTFFVDKGLSNDSHIMVTSVDVAFFRKSATNGVTLDIRTTDNGYPSSKVVSFGRVRKSASEVTVSANGSALTRFTFATPIALSVDTEYAIVVMPEGNDPDYLIWLCKTGQTDIRTGTRITMDANPGTLFTSTNNRAWTPYQDENMKFVVNKANFTTNSGTLVLTNGDVEFFDLESHAGKFIRGETVYLQSNTNGPGTIATTVGSNVINGSGTTFNTTFAINRPIAIRNTVTGAYQVANVVEIVSPTQMIIDEFANVTQSGRTYYRTKTGKVDYFNASEPARLFLKDTSAVSGDFFTSTGNLIGEISGAAATIGAIIDLPVSMMQPSIYRTNFQRTSTKLTQVAYATTAAITAASNNIDFGSNNHLRYAPVVVKSRSNEISQSSGSKSMRFNLSLIASVDTIAATSPVIDTTISSINVIQYFINGLTEAVMTTEMEQGGEADAKIISKQIELEDGMDAEDIKLWLTAYKPAGTQLEVMIKFQALEDPEKWESIPWTRLQLQDNKNFVSSSADTKDFREFVYEMTSTVKGNGMGAYLNNGAFEYKSADGTVFTNYRFFQIKVLMGSTAGHNIVPRVKDMRALALT